jgi:hypothetical protein
MDQKKKEQSGEAHNPPQSKQGGKCTSNKSTASKGKKKQSKKLKPKSTQSQRVWVGVDYLTVSLPRCDSAPELFEELKDWLRPTGTECRGDHGYRGLEICGGYGQLLYRQCSESGDADLLVRLPGRALDWIREKNILSETEYQCTDADICRFFLDRKFTATRIDTAMDTNDPEVSPAKVRECVDQRLFTCHAKSAGVSDSWKLDNPESRGQSQTVYIGSRSSSRFFRCYNKAEDIFKKTGRDVGHLTRFEIEHKGEIAQMVLEMLADYGGDSIPAIFAGWLAFKDPKNQRSRRERSDNAAWWNRLIGGENGVELKLTPSVMDPERSMLWLRKQVAKTLYLAIQYGFAEEICRYLSAVWGKSTDTEKEKWTDYAERCGKTSDDEDQEVPLAS